jgi:hypothetical protein
LPELFGYLGMYLIFENAQSKQSWHIALDLKVFRYFLFELIRLAYLFGHTVGTTNRRFPGVDFMKPFRPKFTDKT